MTAADGVRRRRRPEDVRRAIISAAAEEFERKGLSGARLGEIATAAGVSKASLYAHFPSREDLFAAATLEQFVDFASQWETLWARQAGPTQGRRGHLLSARGDRRSG